MEMIIRRYMACFVLIGSPLADIGLSCLGSFV